MGPPRAGGQRGGRLWAELVSGNRRKDADVGQGHVTETWAPRAQVVNVVGGFGLSWQAAFGVITLLYFYSHYLFASGAAHIGAMYTAFLSVAIACGA